MSYGRVAWFYYADTYPAIKRSKGRSSLDQFDAYCARWADGCHNARQRCLEIRQKAYRGSELTVRRHVHLWRKEGQKTLPPAVPQPDVPTSRTYIWLLLIEIEKLTEEERQLRWAILERSPTIRQGRVLVQSFRAALCRRQVEKLNSWMGQAQQSGLPEFANFAKSYPVFKPQCWRQPDLN